MSHKTQSQSIPRTIQERKIIQKSFNHIDKKQKTALRKRG